ILDTLKVLAIVDELNGTLLAALGVVGADVEMARGERREVDGGVAGDVLVAGDGLIGVGIDEREAGDDDLAFAAELIEGGGVVALAGVDFVVTVAADDEVIAAVAADDVVAAAG